MLKVALRGVLARKFRLTLTGAAVLLGVLFVTTTYVLTDTLDASFDRIFAQSLSGVDVVVRGTPAPGDDDPRRIPDSSAAEVRAVDGVATARGFVQGYAQFVGPDGDAFDKGGPTVGLTFVGAPAGPMRLVDDGRSPSRAPRRGEEVAVDADTAEQGGFHVGDRLDVLSAGARRTFTVVGLFTIGEGATTSPLTFAAFDLPTSQEMAAAPGLLDAVYVRGAAGIAPGALRSQLRAALGPGYEIASAARLAQEGEEDVGRFVDLLTGLLLGFAAIGVVVGGFIIFNTFTILVTQRTRELGLLRAMGASRRQVITTVVIEAAVVGALASAAGIALGVVVARVLLSLVDSLGFRVPADDIVLQSRTVVDAVVVGLGVTVGAALWPAIRASRVPPVAAIADLPEARTAGFRRRVTTGLLLLGASIPVLAVAITRARSSDDTLGEMPLVGLGALLLFFGVVVLLATFARPLARWFGEPVRRVAGVAGTLARGNAMRNPRRTAATASALVIGLALVAMVAILGDSAKAQIDADESDLRADLVIDTNQFTGFSPDVVTRVESLPEVRSAVGFRFGRAPVTAAADGDRRRIVAVNGSGLADAFALRMVDGRAALGPDDVLVPAATASELALRVGDRLRLQLPNGERSLRVAGVYASEDVVGGRPFLVARPVFVAGFPEADLDYRASATVAPGVSIATARRAIEREIGRDFPNLEVLTKDEARDAQADLVDQFLGVLVALLFLSELIAVLGIANTLMLSVYERTHEIGMLRAVGMSRVQLRRSVRWEAVIIAAIGGTVGLVLGVAWAWVFVTALEPEDLFRWSVPPGRLAVLVALAVVAGAVAAIVPAWRASRLAIFEAIARE